MMQASMVAALAGQTPSPPRKMEISVSAPSTAGSVNSTPSTATSEAFHISLPSSPSSCSTSGTPPVTPAKGRSTSVLEQLGLLQATPAMSAAAWASPCATSLQASDLQGVSPCQYDVHQEFMAQASYLDYVGESWAFANNSQVAPDLFAWEEPFDSWSENSHFNAISQHACELVHHEAEAEDPFEALDEEREAQELLSEACSPLGLLDDGELLAAPPGLAVAGQDSVHVRPSAPQEVEPCASAVWIALELDDGISSSPFEPQVIDEPYCGQGLRKHRLPKGLPVMKQLPAWVV